MTTETDLKMEPPFKFELPDGITSLFTIRKRKRERGGGYKLQYAQSKLISSVGIKLFRQYFNGFTFYLEQSIYYVKKPLLLKVSFKKPCLIFIYVMSGDLHSADSGQSTITQSQCFAHLVPAGEYSWLVPGGKKKVLYFTLNPEWLKEMNSEFPELVKIVQRIMDGNVSNQIFPNYRLTVKTLRNLDKFMRFKVTSRIHLETELLRIINILIKEYQHHLIRPNQIENKSNRQVAYEVRDHIIGLVENGIIPYVMDVSTIFNIEPRTLRRFCYKAFGMNMQELITDAQMKIAYKNLKKGRMVKEVALKLGYSEAATFSRRFKDYFGYSPVEIISNNDT